MALGYPPEYKTSAALTAQYPYEDSGQKHCRTDANERRVQQPSITTEEQPTSSIVTSDTINENTIHVPYLKLLISGKEQSGIPRTTGPAAPEPRPNNLNTRDLTHQVSLAGPTDLCVSREDSQYTTKKDKALFEDVKQGSSADITEDWKDSANTELRISLKPDHILGESTSMFL